MGRRENRGGQSAHELRCARSVCVVRVERRALYSLTVVVSVRWRVARFGMLGAFVHPSPHWLDGVRAKGSPMKRRIVLLGFACMAAFPIVTAVADTPPAPAVAWRRSEIDARWVQGQVVVPTGQDAIWARLQQVDRWKDMFSDIMTLRVLEHDGNRWRINLRTTAFDCGAHDYNVRFDDNRTAHLRIDAPGVDAHALMAVKPGARAGDSVVTYSLYVEARGIMSWFVSEATLRKKQEFMVSKYLSDLQRAFTPVAAQANPRS